ncbi:hypothetical protein BJ138DRAFT_1176931 [Hygrophoropsis aurantiaca]|uniref:Uncharacterized protein n=1 Tax=Hygrophoropsis aurantiaca TaxID=72124 RepID=A0ACB8APK9_9AGAM|nr:hypothetical protein BJ138DRAFT_1176931 [Hygrophoropsis aurantiaca]
MLSSPLVSGGHRVLFIPELVDLIFSNLGRSHNVDNACVCKSWSEIALIFIWRDVGSLPRLFNLLRPIEKTRAGYVFQGTPDAHDWARFQKYAARVRRLSFREHMDTHNIVSVLDDVARTRTVVDILPHTHTLEWIYSSVEYMDRSVLFMHNGITNLTVAVPPLHFDRPVFSDMCARMPRLLALDLRVPFAMNLIEDDIISMLQNLPGLKKIALPEYHVTSAIITQLSKMKHIGVVQFEYGEEQGMGDPEDVVPFNPTLGEGAFPALWDLNLTATLEDVNRFFNADFAPINITSLYVDSHIQQTPNDLHILLQTLSENCHNLRQLFVNLLYHEPQNVNLVPDLQIKFHTLKLLLSFPNLVAFELQHEYPVDVTLSQLEELASNWPSLESLVLNQEPFVLREFNLDLRALLPFASHCPSLRRLGLFLDASAAEIPTDSIKPFRSLQTLLVGVSRARNSDAVALFLSQICPPGCNLLYGVTWGTFGESVCKNLNVEIIEEASVRCIPWSMIDDILPLLIQLRREEKVKTRALLEEVEDLRTRNRLLMDRLQIGAGDSCLLT